MHTLSTRSLSALAFDRGEEYDPGQPLSPTLLADLALIEDAAPVVGDDGPYARARQRARERREQAATPAWFSAEDLMVATWEASRFT
jgi:hypothetical protein